MTIDFILDYNNPLYGGAWNEIPRNGAGWDRYVAKVVSRYAGRVRSYEVWNEADNPDFNRGYTTPEDYLNLLKRTYPIIKAHDPGAAVLMTSLSRAQRTNLSFWEKIADRAQPYFDLSNIHVYTSENVSGQVAYLLRLSPTKAIWATEVGAPAENETTQAAFLASVIPQLRSSRVAFVYVFSWRDHLTTVTKHPFGLLRPNNSERPAASTFRRLAG